MTLLYRDFKFQGGTRTVSWHFFNPTSKASVCDVRLRARLCITQAMGLLLLNHNTICFLHRLRRPSTRSCPPCFQYLLLGPQCGLVLILVISGVPAAIPMPLSGTLAFHYRRHFAICQTDVVHFNAYRPTYVKLHVHVSLRLIPIIVISAPRAILLYDIHGAPYACITQQSQHCFYCCCLVMLLVASDHHPFKTVH
jgi:hypothetical protein